ncbi:hypothetical protein ABE607_04980 [Comamonas aquatica]|uniref:hypothetical protein n=1 Tax=Comamonas aquatica TaxID=225991 RepID=UPI003209EF71
MRRSSGTERRKQRGEMLLEALVGMVLLGVLGLSYATARILAQQRYANTQDLALGQMRFALESQGLQALCGGAVGPLQIGAAQLTPTLQCQTQSVSVTVPAGGGLPAMTAPITSVVTQLRYATPGSDAQATQLLGQGSVVIHQ